MSMLFSYRKLYQKTLQNYKKNLIHANFSMRQMIMLSADNQH